MQNAKVHGEPQPTRDYETKVLKNKKLDKECTLKITQNQMSGRIFVEFSSADGKLVLQKSFQNTYEGTKESQEFAKRIKSIKDLHKYFGINKEKKNVTNNDHGTN